MQNFALDSLSKCLLFRRSNLRVSSLDTIGKSVIICGKWAKNLNLQNILIHLKTMAIEMSDEKFIIFTNFRKMYVEIILVLY